jgi:hypothetical protein
MITSYVLLGDMCAIKWLGIEANHPATEVKVAQAGPLRLTAAAPESTSKAALAISRWQNRVKAGRQAPFSHHETANARFGEPEC